MKRLVAAALGCLVAAVGLVGACDDGGSGGSGSGGASGGCPTEPTALFTLHVRARQGSVPPDVRLRVIWSAGEEPEFALDDPSTWLTLDDGTLVECDVERDAGVPVDLEELVCELWTGGTTQVIVTATGYLPVDETFPPAQRDGCDVFVPSSVSVELVRDVDAGVD